MIKRSILVLGNNSLSGQTVKALRYFNKYRVIRSSLIDSDEIDEKDVLSLKSVHSAKDWQDVLFQHKVDKMVICPENWSDENRYRLFELAKACQPLSIQLVYITTRHVDSTELCEKNSNLVKERDLIKNLSGLSRISVIKADSIFDPDTAAGTFLTSMSIFPLIFDIKDVPKLHPLHVLDVVRDVVEVLEKDSEYPYEEYSLAGDKGISIGELQKNIRKSMGLGSAVTIKVPKLIAKGLLYLTGALGSTHMTVARFNRHFGQDLPEADFSVLSEPSFYANKSVLDRIQDKWIYWFARYSLSFMWIWSGLSALFSDRLESMQLMNKVAEGLGSNNMLNVLSAINLSLGALTLAMAEKHLKSLWFVQFWVILIYTTCTMLYAIELINEPLAPITKNFALMALMLYLAKQEEKKLRK